MARGGKAGLGWLILLALPIGWCSSMKDKASTPAPLYTSYTPAHVYQPVEPLQKQHETLTSAPPAELVAPTLSTRARDRRQSGSMYATANVNMRAQPSASSAVVAKLARGEEVITFGSDGKWRDARKGDIDGWIHGDYLTTQLAPSVVSPAVRRPLVAQAESDNDAGSGGPSREPRVGSCDCPYDVMRNGRSCGGRSAYSRPGGRKPKCYD